MPGQVTNITSLDETERVRRLMEHLSFLNVKHENQIMLEPTLKDAHIYCVLHSISAQKYGPLLEKYILTKFNYKKNGAKDCIGDCSKSGNNTEVKVSLGGQTHSKFNFVQIRPSHNCDNYILTAYHLSTDNVSNQGDMYIFRIPNTDMKKLITSYGGYAHGTVKEHGKITEESVNNNSIIKEYALRPTVGDKCWEAMMEFRIQETDL